MSWLEFVNLAYLNRGLKTSQVCCKWPSPCKWLASLCHSLMPISCPLLTLLFQMHMQTSGAHPSIGDWIKPWLISFSLSTGREWKFRMFINKSIHSDSLECVYFLNKGGRRHCCLYFLCCSPLDLRQTRGWCFVLGDDILKPWSSKVVYFLSDLKWEVCFSLHSVKIYIH